MKMFSDCSGPCDKCVTHYTGGCLAGHGDDDFCYIDKECFDRLIKRDLSKHQKEQLINNFSEFVNKK